MAFGSRSLGSIGRRVADRIRNEELNRQDVNRLRSQARNFRRLVSENENVLALTGSTIGELNPIGRAYERLRGTNDAFRPTNIYQRAKDRLERDLPRVIGKSIDRQTTGAFPSREERELQDALTIMSQRPPTLEDATRIQRRIIRQLRPDQRAALQRMGFDETVVLGDDFSFASLADERFTGVTQAALGNWRVLTQTLTHELAHQVGPQGRGETFDVAHDAIAELGAPSEQVPGLPSDERFAAPTIDQLRQLAGPAEFQRFGTQPLEQGDRTDVPSNLLGAAQAVSDQNQQLHEQDVGRLLGQRDQFVPSQSPLQPGRDVAGQLLGLTQGLPFRQQRPESSGFGDPGVGAAPFLPIGEQAGRERAQTAVGQFGYDLRVGELSGQLTPEDRERLPALSQELQRRGITPRDFVDLVHRRNAGDVQADREIVDIRQAIEGGPITRLPEALGEGLTTLRGLSALGGAQTGLSGIGIGPPGLQDPVRTVGTEAFEREGGGLAGVQAAGRETPTEFFQAAVSQLPGTEPVSEFAGRAPVIGDTLEDESRFFLSPLGGALGVLAPGLAAAGSVGALALGGTAEALGAPEPVRIGAQIAGGLATPAGLAGAGKSLRIGDAVNVARRGAPDVNGTLRRLLPERNPVRGTVETTDGLRVEAPVRDITPLDTESITRAEPGIREPRDIIPGDTEAIIRTDVGAGRQLADVGPPREAVPPSPTRAPTRSEARITDLEELKKEVGILPERLETELESLQLVQRRAPAPTRALTEEGEQATQVGRLEELGEAPRLEDVPTVGGGSPLTAARVINREAPETVDVAKGFTSPGEAGRDAIRRYAGAQKEADLLANVWQTERYGQARKLKFPIKRGAKEPPNDDVADFFERAFGDETARGKASHFPPERRPFAEELYARLDETTEALRAADPDFEPSLLSDYFPHLFRVTKGPRGGARGFNLSPGFKRERKLKGTLARILESRPDLDLKTWDPVEYVLRHEAEAKRYIAGLEAIRGLRASGHIALAEGAPAAWRTPNIAPFKMRQALDGWVAHPKVAGALEDMFNPSAFDDDSWLQALKKTRQAAFLIKVAGGLFQVIDFSTRALLGAGPAQFTRGVARGATRLIRGDIKGAARGVTTGTQSAARAWFSPLRAIARTAFPPLDKATLRSAARNKDLRAGYAADLAAGVDTSIGDEAIRGLGDLLPLPGIKQVLNFITGDAYQIYHREMLEQGFLTKLYQHLDEGVEYGRAVDMAVEHTNVFFSSIPNWQSAVRNATKRDLLKFPIFATGELEGMIRIPFQATAEFAGIIGTTAIVAELLNKSATGEWLPVEDLNPYKSEPGFGGALPFSFNTNFLRPQLPWNGPDGLPLRLDILGQMDTQMRFALDPLFAVRTRLGQAIDIPLKAVGTEELSPFGERPESLADVPEFVGRELAPISAGHLFSKERPRLGVTGTALQATGANVNAPRLGEIYEDIFQDLKKESPHKYREYDSYDQLRADDPELAQELRDTERAQEAIERRDFDEDDTSRAFDALEERVQTFKRTQERRNDEPLLDFFRGEEGGINPKQWKDDTRDNQKTLSDRRAEIVEFAGLEFEGGDEPSRGSIGEAIDNYFKVNIEDFETITGSTREEGGRGRREREDVEAGFREINWDAYLAAQDEALEGLSDKDEKRVRRWIKRNFETEVITTIRKLRDENEKAISRYYDLGDDRTAKNRLREREGDLEAMLYITGGIECFRSNRGIRSLERVLDEEFDVDLGRRVVRRCKS